MRAVIILVILGILGTGGWYGYAHWINPPVPVEYKTAKLEKGTLISTVSATGTIEPVLKVLVGTQVSGTIMKWYADFNQKIEEGFVLAELDQERFKVVVEQRKAAAAVAKARVEEAKAQLTKASMDCERIERMYKKEAATDYEYRQAKADEAVCHAALLAAQAQSQAAEADVQQATVELDKTIIRSPIDGVVISRDVDEGQTVAAAMNTPTLFTIANDLTKMRVNAAVSEMDIGKVRDGMKAEFKVDAYPNKSFSGTVSQVRYAEKIENNVVTYTTLITVDNPELLLRPGMTARIQFEVERVENAVKVPNAALRFLPREESEKLRKQTGKSETSQSPCVYQLKDGKPAKVAVTLGLNDGKFTAITSGNLEAGDVVVTAEEGGKPKRGSR
ncbi:MAG: efflux RND transporter periplasmic adaptor subunit [Phycisphaerae bacterium]|nr:efflux RND transporter periplasmic adaptor subunit [Phycisphaerae bacterium]